MTKMVYSGIMGRKPNMPMPMPIPNGEKPKGFIKLWPATTGTDETTTEFRH